MAKYLIRWLIVVMMTACVAVPEALREGQSTYHLVNLKTSLDGEGGLEQVKALPGGILVFETARQKAWRTGAAKNGEPYDQSQETLFYFMPSKEDPGSLSHMLWISQARAEQIANKIASDEAKRIQAQRKREQEEARRAREADRARDEAIAAQREKCLSKGRIGVCQQASGSKTTYLCGMSGFAQGQIFNPDCYYADHGRVVVKLLTRNNTGVLQRDLTFRCQQIARSGTVLRTDAKTLYELWRPGETKPVSLEFFRHEQTHSVVCEAK